MRTVSVKLEADIRNYTTNMRKAGDETRALGSEMDKTAKGRRLDLKAAETEFAQAARQVGEIDRKIRDTESGMRSLAKAFADTGDPKILAAWKEQGRTLGELRSVRKFLPDPAEMVKAGTTLGARVGDGILKSVPPQMSQAIFLGAAAGAPLAAATIIGAITGGTALAGIGGGIALSMKDPKIKAQAKDLGADLSSILRRSAASFGEAMPDAIGKVRTLVSSMQGDLDGLFTSSAGMLGPFLDQLAPGIQSIVSGLSSVAQKAGPTLAVIGSGLSDVLDQVGIFMEMIASNSDIGAKALNDLFAVIEFGLQTLTVSIDMLATAYKYTLGWTSLFTDAGDAVDEFGKTEGDAAGKTNALGFEVETTGKKVEIASQKFVALNDQIQATVDRNLSAAESNIAMRQAVKDLTDSIDKKVKVSDDERTALIGYARTTNSATKALDEQGRTVGQATRAHEANRKKLIETAMKMGYTRAEAKRLADQYLAIPKNVGTGISQPGMKQSRAEVKAYQKQLDKVYRKVTTDVKVTGDSAAYAKLKRLLVAQQAATKGISVSAATSAFNKQEAKAYYGGGRTGGTDPHAPAGVVHQKEMVLNAKTVEKVDRTAPGFLDELHATGQLPGYATGGRVGRMPFNVNASMTKVISLQDALSMVAPAFSGSAGTGGTLPFILNAVHSQFPGMRLISGRRPGATTLSGNRSLHADNRAGDFPPSYEMAKWWDANYGSRTKEFISPYQQFNRLNGRRKRFTGAVWNQHNFAGGNPHNHIGMEQGGTIMEPVFGVGASGTSYSFGEGGKPERVIPGTGSATGGGGTTMVNVNINVAPTANRAEIGREVAGVLESYLGQGGSVTVRGVRKL